MAAAGAWAPAAGASRCQSRLPLLQAERGRLGLPGVPAAGSCRRAARCPPGSPCPTRGLRAMGTVSELCASSFQAFLCPSVAAKAGRCPVPSASRSDPVPTAGPVAPAPYGSCHRQHGASRSSRRPHALPGSGPRKHGSGRTAGCGALPTALVEPGSPRQSQGVHTAQWGRAPSCPSPSPLLPPAPPGQCPCCSPAREQGERAWLPSPKETCPGQPSARCQRLRTAAAVPGLLLAG